MAADRFNDCEGCSRREVLTRLMHLGISVVTAGVVSGCPGGSTWGRNESAEHSSAEGRAENIRVLAVDVPLKSALELTVAGRSAYLVHAAEGEWYALDRACTHKGTRINFVADKGEFLCPNHKSRFALDGAILKKPATERLAVWDVVVDGEYVEVVVTGVG